jgi:uncharacterized protein involved in exopolysaccharide biosynthesis
LSSSFQDPIEPHSTFDAKDYAVFLYNRWRFIVAASVFAGLLAGGVSMLTPARYTSTASILIEAPAGNDARISTSVTPVYLESLKTYEVFATSDALFLQAANKFQLRGADSGETIEALKARTLKVAKLRDTKVMQLSVTLKNPKDAQAMSQYLAEETVKLSNSIAHDSGAGLVEIAQNQADAAKAKLDETQTALAKETAAQPIESLKPELESMIDLQYGLKRMQAESAADAAEYESLAKGSSGTESSEEKSEQEAYRRRSASMRIRETSARNQAAELEKQISAKSTRLAERQSRQRKLEEDLAHVQRVHDAASKRAQDLKASLGLSGERLKIIDPGGIPERPSEPRTGLRVAAALGIAMLASVVYLSFSYGFRS